MCRQQNLSLYFMPRSHGYNVRTYRIQVFLRHTLAFCDPLLQCIVSTREHIAYLGEAPATKTRKNAQPRTTGDKHQVPSHSTSGQKRTARDRHKPPVGLLKGLPDRQDSAEAFGFTGEQGKNLHRSFFLKCQNFCLLSIAKRYLVLKRIPTKRK